MECITIRGVEPHAHPLAVEGKGSDSRDLHSAERREEGSSYVGDIRPAMFLQVAGLVERPSRIIPSPSAAPRRRSCRPSSKASSRRSGLPFTLPSKMWRFAVIETSLIAYRLAQAEDVGNDGKRIVPGQTHNPSCHAFGGGLTTGRRRP